MGSRLVKWIVAGLPFAKWGYRIVIGIFWIAGAFGYGPKASNMIWIGDFEIWLDRHVADPILFAFASGLILSTWIIPDVWKWSKKHLVKESKTKLEVSGPHLLSDHLGNNRWRFRVHNHGSATANNVQMQLQNINPRPKYDRWQADYPYPVSRVGKTLNEPPSRINLGDEENYEVWTWLGSDGNHYASIDTRDKVNQTAIESSEVLELEYDVTAENADRVCFSMQMSVKCGALIMERKGQECHRP